MPENQPRGHPLSALVELLEGAVLAPPDRLAAIAAAAGQALGVRVRVHLVDYDQQRLHLLPADHDTEADRQPQDVDTTLAGRAFRHVEVLAATTAGRPRLWVPLVDGVERLGVLEVEVGRPDELHDPGLRAQCWWLAALLGHLVSAMGQYGDTLERVRTTRPRSPSAELIWSLLPPLTCGVDNFVISGTVQPGDAVSGDAFDYALSETAAQLMILDAVGHDLRSGLVAATVLSTYRAARRAGHGLFEQARLIDQTLADEFGSGMHATGVLAEIDLPTGRLRYLNAGHPPPLVLRAGKVVKPLTGGHRLPLGLGPTAVTVGEEALEPDDWLVLHTDGITEARSPTGEFFGEDRLVDFVRREAAAGHPPPETVRRLINAVLAHQHGVLQDDATVVLTRWTTDRHLTR